MCDNSASSLLADSSIDEEEETEETSSLSTINWIKCWRTGKRATAT